MIAPCSTTPTCRNWNYRCQRGTVLGDSGYPLRSYLLTPFFKSCKCQSNKVQCRSDKSKKCCGEAVWSLEEKVLLHRVCVTLSPGQCANYNSCNCSPPQCCNFPE